MKIIHRVKEQLNQEEQFLNILLDETIAEDDIWIEEKLLRQTGTLNDQLKEKQMYELLLRMAEKTALCIETAEEVFSLDGYRLFEKKTVQDVWESIRTDCYIIGRYKEKLIQASVFDEIVKSVLEYAAGYGLETDTVQYLESMLSGSDAYTALYDRTQPVLIYKGEDICHNVLNVFAEQIGEALERLGQPVEYFDPEKQGLNTIVEYMGRRYRAILGIQTYLFSIKLKDEVTYVHESIRGPKYNLILDHPIWMKNHLQHHLPQFTVLTHDQNYVDFLEKRYGLKAKLMPPGGLWVQESIEEKKYNLSFVGTYGDYWNEVLLIHQMERKQRFLANRYLLKLRKNPNRTAEDVWDELLEEQQLKYTGDEYIERFHEMRRVVYCVIHYYRKKAIEAILKNGIELDVFGDSWRYSPLRKYENLICHPNVTVDESVKIWQQSKMSLNIMSWHKGGFTERMAGILLAKAVLVTDATSYLQNRFEDEKDLLIFDLEEIDALPAKLQKYLNQPDCLERMAQHGYEKAVAEHTWDVRAKWFLEEIEG